MVNLWNWESKRSRVGLAERNSSLLPAL